MYIEYSETDAFFGNYQRVVNTLSNDDPCHTRQNDLDKCRKDDIIVFERDLLSKSMFSLKINNTRTYVAWGDLWHMYANFDERIGIIKNYDYSDIHIKGHQPISFNDIEPEEFMAIVCGKSFHVLVKFCGYRINYSNPKVNRELTEEAIFRCIEKQLYEENFDSVKGMTSYGKCLSLIEIDK
jgi:hypothetical protein